MSSSTAMFEESLGDLVGGSISDEDEEEEDTQEEDDDEDE